MAPNADIAEKDHLWMGTNYKAPKLLGCFVFAQFVIGQHDILCPFKRL